MLLPEGTSHGLIVHVGFVLVFAPQLGHSFGVHQLEDTFLPLSPLNVPGTGVLILQQVQKELPQVRTAYSAHTHS